MIKIIQTILQILVLALAATSVFACPSHNSDDQKNIRALINTTYDQPQKPVVIDPIVVQGQHAVASWIQQDKGGRVVLFRNTEGNWEIVLCSGKAVTEAEFLAATGISQTDADALAKKLIAAELTMDKEKIALFDSFNGVVRGAHQAGHDVHAKHDTHAEHNDAHGGHDKNHEGHSSHQ